MLEKDRKLVLIPAIPIMLKNESFESAHFQNSTDCIGERNHKVKVYYC